MTQKDSSGIVLAAPVYFLLFLVLGFGLEYFLPLSLLPVAAPALVGYAIVALSFLLLWRVDREFSKCETNASCRMGDAALITTGPFRYSRNPAYVAMSAMVIGFSVTTNNLWLLLLVLPTCLAVYQFCISKEEAYLAGKFGDEYSRYKASVRRWL